MKEISKPVNREDWLTKFAALMRPWFQQRWRGGFPARILCAHGGVHGHEKWAGIAYSRQMTRDGVAHIYISPILGRGEELEIASTMCHEMVHATVGNLHGHRGDFRLCCDAIGLEPAGKGRSYTNTVLGEELKQHVMPLLSVLGPFPVQGVNRKKPADKEEGEGKENRKVKAYCPECKSVWIGGSKSAQKGLPLCGNNECEAFGEPMIVGDR